MKTTFKTIYQPKEGKKFGNAVVDKDTKYLFMPGPVPLEAGVEYDITVKRAKWGETEVQLLASVDGKPFQTESKSGGGFGGVKGDPKLDFAGRCVAAAITSGKVKSMKDLKSWAQGAYKVAAALK